VSWRDAAKTVGAIAPGIGAALGGPAGAAVGSLAARALGVAETPQALAKAAQEHPEVALAKLQALEAVLSDRQDARAMQVAALQQDDKASKRFIYVFAAAWSLFAMLFILGITFFGVPEDSVRFADTVLGFLLGTLIAAIIQFFFGSSSNDQERGRREGVTALLKDPLK